MINEIEPLAYDPKRQATDTIKGYVYQVWKSLDTWINLSENEVMFLEGAEDFDQLSQSNASTTQVKHLLRNITLRSTEVIEAISNYWTMQQQEKRKVIFHFFTTAKRGLEKTNPFNGIKGLDYWEKCKEQVQVNPLRQFLLSISDFPYELKDFLKNSSEDELLNKLIIPIRWLTEREDLDELRKNVEDALILYGNKDGTNADTSKKAAPILVDFIWTKLCKKDIKERYLRKADFISKFEDISSVTISKSEYTLLKDASKRLFEKFLNQNVFNSSSNFENKISTQISKPHIPDKSLFIIREKLKQVIISKLKTEEFLMIIGSSGLGKSILSLQAIEDEQDEWEIVNFRGLDSNNIKDVINGLCYANTHIFKNIILDDINFGQDHDIYIGAFEKYIFLLRNDNKKVLVTSQNKLPSNLSAKFNLSANNDILVSVFNHEEIKTLLLLNLCSETELDFWLRDIKITTKSHPQLVHARIRRLKSEGWDKSKSIFKTEELSDVKRQFVSSLTSNLPNQESRDLLIRISILFGSFKQKNVLALASYPCAIRTPSVYFNQLIGPYIEQVTEEYFTLTPLLDGAFQNNFTENEIKELHTLAGVSYISNILTPRDLSSIFFHGIMSGSSKILSYAYSAFQSIQDIDKPLILPYLEWLKFVHINTNQMAVPQNDIYNLMFRFVQFTIAIKTNDSESALKIANIWFDENNKFIAKDDNKKKKEEIYFPIMFFINVFRFDVLPISINEVNKWINTAYDFLEINPNVNNAIPEYEQNFKERLEKFIFPAILIKKISLSNIEDFILSLENLPVNQKLISNINNSPMLSERFVDIIWMDQVNVEKPDWQKVLIVLGKLRNFTAERNAFRIAASVVRAKAIIFNEYLNNKDEANNIIEKGIQEFGEYPELINYQAKIAFLDHNYSLSIKIWNKILPKLSEPHSPGFVFACRDAAVAAANLDDWNTSLLYFKKASVMARDQKDELYETQCLADCGFVYWKSKEYELCIETFIKVIEKLPKLPDPKNNLRSLGLLKMTSNTLLYIQNEINSDYRKIKEKFAVPFAGIHSQLEFNKKLQDLPIPSPSSFLTILAEVEIVLNVGKNAFDKLEAISYQLPILFQAKAKEVEIIRSLKTCDLKTIVSKMVDFFTLTYVSGNTENSTEVVKLINEADIQQALLKQGPVIIHLIASTLLCFDSLFSYKEIPWIYWKKIGKEIGLEKLKEWTNFIEIGSEMKIENARKIINDANEENALRVTASIFILNYDENKEYILYASTLLTIYLHDFIEFCWILDGYLEDILTRKWKEIANYSFDIRHDKESEDVLKICNDNEIKGLRKVARIVLSASNISSFKIENIKDKLTKIAYS